jgi:hypothetical protein
MSKKRQTSYRVMIGLNVLIWLLQTIHNALALYQTWIAFIKYAGDPDQSVLILEGGIEPSHTILKIRYILSTMPPAIADTIMARIAQFYTAIASIDDVPLAGMEMLGYLQS